MKVALVVAFVLVCFVGQAFLEGRLQIGVKKRPETCDLRTKKGDRLTMHYNVSEKH